MTQQPVLSIKATKAGVEIILGALAKLPYEHSAGLIREIEGQANYQLQQLEAAAKKAAEPAETPAPADTAINPEEKEEQQ
jgi:hypothetical protein